jgi:lipopolysaccharide heptosyltransferase I
VTDGSPRFLIVRLGSLGDVIHAIPAAAALRRRYPEARIDWLVDPSYAGLLKLVSGLDEIVPLNTRGPLLQTLSTIGRLRRQRYDVAIDLQGLIKSAALARSAGARRTLGMPREHLREPMAGSLYTDTVGPGDAVHVVHRNLRMLSGVGVEDVRVMFPLQIPATDATEAVAARFARDEYVVINAGAAWPNKRWPAGRFGALAAAIRERRGLRTLVLWGPGEQGLAEAVVSASSGAAETAPPTAVVDLFGIVQHARLLVAGDTGPLHIGPAVGTPIVALFGPTMSERNGSWVAADVAVSRYERCVCHYERRCRLSTPCIEDIGVDEVLAAVERRLDHND